MLEGTFLALPTRRAISNRGLEGSPGTGRTEARTNTWCGSRKSCSSQELGFDLTTLQVQRHREIRDLGNGSSETSLAAFIRLAAEPATTLLSRPDSHSALPAPLLCQAAASSESGIQQRVNSAWDRDFILLISEVYGVGAPRALL